VLNRVDATLDAAAVADVRGGLPRKAKLAKTLSMPFFSTAGMLWLYSAVANSQASSSAILEFPMLHNRRAKGPGSRVAHGGKRSAEQRQRKVPKAGDVNVESAVLRRHGVDPGDYLVGGAARPDAAKDDLEVQDSRPSLLGHRLRPVGSVAAGSWRHR
jgi:hypothetical protein